MTCGGLRLVWLGRGIGRTGGKTMRGEDGGGAFREKRREIGRASCRERVSR